MGVAGEDELLDARVWYSVMRSATSAWLPTSAVHVPPPHEADTPAHRFGAISRLAVEPPFSARIPLITSR